nr:MAG TPA: hypothetical protein [Caudoviricetes sp.]
MWINQNLHSKRKFLDRNKQRKYTGNTSFESNITLERGVFMNNIET